MIFIVVSATFYGGLAARVPGLDPSDPAVRAQFAPLNPPKGDVLARDRRRPAKEASVDAFQVAALVRRRAARCRLGDEPDRPPRRPAAKRLSEHASPRATRSAGTPEK